METTIDSILKYNALPAAALSVVIYLQAGTSGEVQDMRGDIQALRTEMNAEFRALRTEMAEGHQEIRAEMVKGGYFPSPIQQQVVERLGGFPLIGPEVALIGGQNSPVLEVRCGYDQGGIGHVHGKIRILLHQ